MAGRACRLLIVAACLFLWGSTALATGGNNGAPPPAMEAGARTGMRIALVPLIDRTGGWLTRGGAKRLAARMERELHIPLNGTMHWATFIDADETTAALREALAAQGKKPRPELAARDAAQRLDADLVLFLVVEQFYQHIFHSLGWNGSTYIESSVRLAVYGYDARHGRLIRSPAWRFERAEYRPAYEAEELAAEALDEVLGEARPADAIFPLSGDGRPPIEEGDEANVGRI